MSRTKPRRRQTAREISAGGVVFRRGEQGVQYLLIRDSYGRWALPKGKIEKGESTEQAALREIHEEVGLSEVVLRDSLPSIRYVYTDPQGIVKFKAVHFFLVELVGDQEPRPDTNEIAEARWFSAEEMLDAFEYPDTEDVLARAVELVQQNTQ